MARVDGMARGPRRRWRKNVRLLARDGSVFGRPAAWVGTYLYPDGLAGALFSPISILSTGKLKAWYDASQATAVTLASDDFTRTAVAPVVKVSDTFTRTAIVSDDFSDADGTSLSGKATDTGQTWLTGGAATPTIQSGAANVTSSGHATVETGLTDVAVACSLPSVATQEYVELRARHADDNNYFRMVHGTPGLDANIYIQKTVAGVSTSLVMGGAGGAAVGDTLQFRVIGSSFVAIKNGVQYLSVTDASLPSNTRAGFGLSDGGFAVQPGRSIDNFSVTRADLGTAETGDTWIEGSGDWGITADGKAKKVSVADDVAVLDSGMADLVVSGTIVRPAVGANAGLVVRYSDINNFIVGLVSGTSLLLFKKVAGVYTQLAVGTVAGLTHALTLRAFGNNLEMTDGTVTITAIEAFNNTATRSGFRDNAAATSDISTFDTFSISTPATGVSDDFSDTTGTTVNGKATDTGQTWVATAGMTVSDGKLVHGAINRTARVESGIADVAVQADFVLPAGNADTQMVYRYTDENNFYWTGIAKNVSHNGLTPQKCVGGAFTSLGAVAGQGYVGGQTLVVQTRVIGSSHQTLVDGVVKLSFTDAAFLTPSVHGLTSRGVYASDAGTAWDNFSVTRADLGFATGLNGAKIPWVEGSGDWGVDSAGRAFAPSGAVPVAYIETRSTDVDIRSTITTGTGNSPGNLLLRFVDLNNFVYEHNTVGTSAIGLRQNLAGVDSAIAATTTYATFTPSVSSTYTIRAVVKGSVITLFANDTRLADYPAPAGIMGTKYGYRGSGGTNPELVRYDTFSVATPTLAANDPISVLPDLSGNGNHAVQATAANQPKFTENIFAVVAGVGKPSARFDGVNDVMTSARVANTAKTLFVVAKKQTAVGAVQQAVAGYAADAALVANSATGTGWSYATNAAAANVHIGGAPTTVQVLVLTQINPSLLTTYIGSTTGPTLDSAVSLDTSVLLAIGAATAAAQFGDYDLASIVEYDGALNHADRTTVVSYLTTRFAAV